MNIDFEVFDPQRSEIPTIIVQPNKYLAINAAAYQALGKPERVQLLFDRTVRLVALRAAEAGTPLEDSYPVKSRTGAKRFTPGLICAAAYCTHYDIPTGIKLQAKLIKGMLVAMLPKG